MIGRMGVSGIDHLNISGRPDLIARCRDFYVDVLGLAEGYRPPFSSRGFWLYAGDRPIVHLTESAAANEGAALDHIAFACDGADELIERLQRSGVEYQVNRVPGTEQLQLFLRDPAGVGVELNFSPPSRRP